MNGFPESQTAEMFEKDENRILVVANKYLTGFDQPKLCAMYIANRWTACWPCRCCRG